MVVPHRQPPRRVGADILAPERVVAHADEGFRPVKMTPPLQPPPPRCTLRETYVLEIAWDDPEDDGGDQTHCPYISPISPLYLPYTAPISPVHRPYTCRIPPVYRPYTCRIPAVYLPYISQATRSSSGPSSARPTSPSGTR